MSTIAAGTTSGTALVSTGDTNGTLVLQTNGTTTAVTIGTNQVVTLAQPLPAASGGTGSTATPTAGGIPYGTGSATAFTAAGTSGQVLTSAGSSAPTWATSSPPPGATDVGSAMWRGQRGLLIAGPSASLYTLTSNTYASAILDMALDQNYPISNSGNPCYSTYYSAWVTAGATSIATLSLANMFTSASGAGWRTAQTNILQASGTKALSYTTGTMNGPSLAIDDSNGRYFVWAYNTATSIDLYLVSRGTAAGNTGTYVNSVSTSNPYGQPEAAFVYPIYNGTTFAGIVYGFFLLGSGYNFGYIAPGGTSASSTATVSSSSGSGSFGGGSQWFDHNPTLGRVIWMVVATSGTTPTIIYNTTAGNFTAYTTVAAPAASTTNANTGVAISNTYVAYYNQSGNIYYSTTPASGWTTLTTPLGAGSVLYALYWVNGYWIANVLLSGGVDRLTYICSTAIPNTWTLLGAGYPSPSKFSIRKV